MGGVVVVGGTVVVGAAFGLTNPEGAAVVVDAGTVVVGSEPARRATGADDGTVDVVASSSVPAMHW